MAEGMLFEFGLHMLTNCVMIWKSQFFGKECARMKHHKYWAICTMFCFLMTMYTGHKHI